LFWGQLFFHFNAFLNHSSRDNQQQNVRRPSRGCLDSSLNISAPKLSVVCVNSFGPAKIEDFPELFGPSRIVMGFGSSLRKSKALKFVYSMPLITFLHGAEETDFAERNFTFI
jgi:hypothetical protein